MDYFWKEHKKILMAVGGGLLALFLYYTFALNPIRAGAVNASRQLRIEQQNLQAKMAAGVPTDDTVARARREAERTRQQLATLKDDAGFKVGDRFLNVVGGNAKTHFESLKLDIHRELKEKARKLTAFPADFKMAGVGDDLTEEGARDLLLRLAVVERLVLLALDAKVDRIDLVDGLYGHDAKGEAVPKGAAFLRRESVLLRFKGESEAVFRVLHAAQKKGTYLAVNHFEASRQDATKDYLSAAIGVSLLRIDEKAPITPKPEEAGP